MSVVTLMFALVLAYSHHVDFGGEPLSDLARGKTQSWKEFVHAQDWSKVLI